jgi:glycosyltransferase involved in cell wall biosynthesis
MNILYLIESSEPGGAESLVVSLANGFRNRGNTCVIGLLEDGWLNDQLKAGNFETIMLQQNRSYDFPFTRELYSIIRKYNIDIIHAHEFAMNTYGTIIGALARLPVITTIHGQNYYWLKLRRRVAYRMASRLSKMVAVSESLKSFLSESVGIEKSRIITLHNGIEVEKYNVRLDAKQIFAIKNELSISDHQQVVATVGMLVPVKDHMMLIDAAYKVLRCCPNTVFLVIGDGPLRHKLTDHAKSLGIERNLRFTGFKTCIAEILQIIDVYVCSSISEGLSLSILEAMAARKPVIATNVGGNPEIIVHGENGFLVPQKNAEELSIKIIMTLRDNQLADRLGSNGQQNVQQKFSREQMIDQYKHLYENALFDKVGRVW